MRHSKSWWIGYRQMSTLQQEMQKRWKRIGMGTFSFWAGKASWPWLNIMCTKVLLSVNILFIEITVSCGPKLCTIFCVFYLCFTDSMMFHQRRQHCPCCAEERSKWDSTDSTSLVLYIVWGPWPPVWVPQHCWILSSC